MPGRFIATLVLLGLLGLWLPAWGEAPPTVSLDVQDADLRDVLRLLATVGGVSLVLGPEVKGKVTTRLVDVSWQQAFDALLRVHGLAWERQGDVVVVLPAEKLLRARQQQLALQRLQQQGEAAVTRVIAVKYRDATELQRLLEAHFGACATFSADPRTNTLLVTGPPSCWQGR
ncbi:MAG: hypothetical protein KatS3mg131_0900 [Candidatus Tectimicrobiota bacterium]|nr:MAG: hypothetical protein KatS3mg131_0900 [Candidatus Tectomicrobia bacterium]